jgi:hypothetical protein
MRNNHWGRQAAGNWSFNGASRAFRSPAHPMQYFNPSFALLLQEFVQFCSLSGDFQAFSG